MGLWLARRWGEYFAMVATSLGLPVEIYELSHKVTVTALIFLAVNLALVAVPGDHQAAVRRPRRQARLRRPPAQRLSDGEGHRSRGRICFSPARHSPDTRSSLTSHASDARRLSLASHLSLTGHSGHSSPTGGSSFTGHSGRSGHRSPGQLHRPARHRRRGTPVRRWPPSLIGPIYPVRRERLSGASRPAGRGSQPARCSRAWPALMIQLWMSRCLPQEVRDGTSTNDHRHAWGACDWRGHRGHWWQPARP